MFNYIKSLFNKSYTLGSFESPIDVRNIALSSFQEKNENLPVVYKTEMTAVRNQGQVPKCVASSVCEVAELYFKDKGINVNLSDDDLYAQCKEVDGIPSIPGTYPNIGAHVAYKKGIATIEAYESGDISKIEESRKKHKIGGYAFTARDYDSICQAIYKNKAVTASIAVDQNWFLGKIMKVIKAVGRHQTVLHGFDISMGTLKGMNSWGVGWIGKLGGLLSRDINPGHFELFWKDYDSNIIDIIAYTDIPDEILKDAQSKKFYFFNNMKFGSRGQIVKELQKRLNEEGFNCGTPDGVFGLKTMSAVKAYQKSKGLYADGSVGYNTRKALNGKVELVDALIQVESQGNDNAIGDKNLKDKAYGCLQIRKPCVDDVNRSLGTNYKAEDMLGNRKLSIEVFNQYMELYAKGQSDEYKARTWNGGPSGFKKVATEIYWQKVKLLM